MQKKEPNDGYYVVQPKSLEDFDKLYQFTQDIKMLWLNTDLETVRNCYKKGNTHWYISLKTKEMQAFQIRSVTCSAATCCSSRPVYSIGEVIVLIRNSEGR